MHLSTITLKDIAKALNITPSTVSKALRDSHEISGKTKSMVLEYARKHNYYPNPIAQGLKKGASKSIGVVVSTIDNQFFSQVINGIESEAYRQGYHVIITQTHESALREAANVNHLTHRSIDGLLISLSTETQDVTYLQKLQQQGLPIVFFDRITNQINTHKVIVDNYTGAYEATAHLINCGYKRIAHITSSVNTSITNERLDGFKQAMTDYGMHLEPSYVKHCTHGGRDVDEVNQALDELLSSDIRPDAIFTAWDRLTTTTLTSLKARNIKIPGDTALLGFTNTMLAADLNPPLSVVYQPALEMGQRATAMLLNLIGNKQPVTQFETLVLPATLIIRQSSSGSNIANE